MTHVSGLTHEQIARSLSYIRPGEAWSLDGDELTWLDSTAEPTQAEIEGGWAALQSIPVMDSAVPTATVQTWLFIRVSVDPGVDIVGYTAGARVSYTQQS